MSEQVEAGGPGEQGAAGADATTRIDDTGAVYRRIRPDEHEAVNELIALGFGRPGATSFAMEVTRPESFRVIEADGELVAALDKNDLGQFWLGRRMPSTQICRVATVPHGGGRGYAGALMTGYLHELHETGTPTATLFASTLALYRAAGFECAGDWTEYSLRAEHLPRRTAPYRADRVPLDDLDEIRALYKVIAPTRHGALDRDEAWWRWLIGRDRGSTVAFVLRDPDGAAAGWAIVGFGSEEGWRVRARVIDWGCLPGAERALYGVLGSYGPLDGVVTWSGPDPDPSLFVLPDRQFGHYGPETPRPLAAAPGRRAPGARAAGLPGAGQRLGPVLGRRRALPMEHRELGAGDRRRQGPGDPGRRRARHRERPRPRPAVHRLPGPGGAGPGRAPDGCRRAGPGLPARRLHHPPPLVGRALLTATPVDNLSSPTVERATLVS